MYRQYPIGGHFARWKTFLKGFFDTYGDRLRVLVTGSFRLDVYRRGGDSLMGRYFLRRWVVKDRMPWFLVEAKRTEDRLSPAL